MKKVLEKLQFIGVNIFVIITYIVMIEYLVDPLESMNLESFMLWQKLLFILAFIGIFLFGILSKVIIHELGHMICGLISGYKFIAIGIFNYMIIKEDKHIYVNNCRKDSGGECIMLPPATNGSSPFILYILGGSIATAIFSMLFTIAAILCESTVVRHFFVFFAIDYFLSTLKNIIPIKYYCSNDGLILKRLLTSPEFRLDFEKQYFIQGELFKGKRLKDLPYDLFKSDIEKALSGESEEIDITILSYLIDCKRLDEAYQLCNDIYNDCEVGDVISLREYSVLKGILISEMLSILLLTDKEKKEIDKLFTPEAKLVLNKESSKPYVQRALYIYELLYNKDLDKAESHKDNFCKVAGKYPYMSELHIGIELMVDAQMKYNQMVIETA